MNEVGFFEMKCGLEKHLGLLAVSTIAFGVQWNYNDGDESLMLNSQLAPIFQQGTPRQGHFRDLFPNWGKLPVELLSAWPTELLSPTAGLSQGQCVSGKLPYSLEGLIDKNISK